MRSLLSRTGLWTLVSLGILCAGGAAGETSAEELIQLEREWSAAFLRKDVASVDRILADDFVGIDGRGWMTAKKEELEEIRAASSDWQVLSETLDDFKVRIYGDTAVVTARNTERVLSKGEERAIRFRRTTVWVRRDGHWQCVSFHGSRILEPAG